MHTHAVLHCVGLLLTVTLKQDSKPDQFNLFRVGTSSRESAKWTFLSSVVWTSMQAYYYKITTHIIFPLKRDNTTINDIGWAQFRSMTCSHSSSAAIPSLIMAWREHGEVNKATVFFLDGGK